MTSTPVMDIGMLQTYPKETGGILPASGSDFKDNLMAAMEAGGNVESVKAGNVSEIKGAETKRDVSSIDKTSRDANSNVNRDKVKSDTEGSKAAKTNDKPDKISSDQEKAIGEKAQEVVKKVSEELDVSEEEVVQAMETLGLSLVDLLNPDNMTDLVAILSGNEDALSLVTNESLYETLGNLQDFVNQAMDDLSTELDLSQEALEEVLKQAEELLKQSIDDSSQIVESDSNDQSFDTLSLEGMKDYKATTFVDGKEVTLTATVDESTGVTVTTVNQTNLSQSNNEDKSGDKQSGNKSDEDSTQASLFTQTTQMNNIDTAGIDQMTEQVNGFESNTIDIAKQILESMKANLKPEMTELEMNLHPASLGSVRVNLTAQNGQISAQFIAQNESVRAAIESQIVQLTNQLEDQGIKVEHVEVAVADHRFDRGTENGAGENQNNEGNASKAKAGRIRRINLSAFDGEDDLEELEESDRIAAEMMAHNGNTVDYMV